MRFGFFCNVVPDNIVVKPCRIIFQQNIKPIARIRPVGGDRVAGIGHSAGGTRAECPGPQPGTTAVKMLTGEVASDNITR